MNSLSIKDVGAAFIIKPYPNPAHSGWLLVQHAKPIYQWYVGEGLWDMKTVPATLTMPFNGTFYICCKRYDARQISIADVEKDYIFKKPAPPSVKTDVPVRLNGQINHVKV